MILKNRICLAQKRARPTLREVARPTQQIRICAGAVAKRDALHLREVALAARATRKTHSPRPFLKRSAAPRVKRAPEQDGAKRPKKSETTCIIKLSRGAAPRYTSEGATRARCARVELEVYVQRCSPVSCDLANNVLRSCVSSTFATWLATACVHGGRRVEKPKWQNASNEKRTQQKKPKSGHRNKPRGP